MFKDGDRPARTGPRDVGPGRRHRAALQAAREGRAKHRQGHPARRADRESRAGAQRVGAGRERAAAAARGGVEQQHHRLAAGVVRRRGRVDAVQKARADQRRPWSRRRTSDHAPPHASASRRRTSPAFGRSSSTARAASIRFAPPTRSSWCRRAPPANSCAARLTITCWPHPVRRACCRRSVPERTSTTHWPRGSGPSARALAIRARGAAGRRRPRRGRRRPAAAVSRPSRARRRDARRSTIRCAAWAAPWTISTGWCAANWRPRPSSTAAPRSCWSRRASWSPRFAATNRGSPMAREGRASAA